MSIIVEKMDGKSDSVLVYIKGADNMIYERLANNNPEQNKKLEMTKRNVEEWSVEGLRTLVFAKREIKK